MTDLPAMTSPLWADPATVSTLAAGLDPATPVVVLTPPDGSCLWRDRCPICEFTRAECVTWEAHYVAWRRRRMAQLGRELDLSRCGRCGGHVDAGGVQRDGLRYCTADHAAPDVVVLPRASVWLEVGGVLTEVFEPVEPAAGWVAGGQEVSR